MSELTVWTPPIVRFQPRDLANIRDLYARDATPPEFERFIRMCEVRGLDPRLGHAYLFLFNTDPKSKKPRQAVTVISEGGYLAAADRIRDNTGNSIYLPDDQVPVFTYDQSKVNAKTNPLGLVSCTVSVRKFVQGEWHRIPAEVFWDERAPIGDEWVYDQGLGKSVKTGDQALDPKKTGWIKQGRNMLAKCARVAACRYAFPDFMGNLYSEEEKDAIERGTLEVIDLTPDEQIAEAKKKAQMEKIGADKAIPLIFDQDKGIEYIPLGMAHDRMEAAFRARPDAAEIQHFCKQNRIGIAEFLAQGHKDEWVDLRERYIDAAAAEMKRREAAKQEQADGQQAAPAADD